MTFRDRAREARLNAAMETLRGPEATPHDVAQARAAIGAPTTDLWKLTDAELTIWIFLREKLAGRESASENPAELATHAQALADALALPTTPGCRRCKVFEDGDLAALAEAIKMDEVVEAEPVAALPEGDPDASK